MKAMRRILVAVFTAFALALSAVPASAEGAGAVSETIHLDNAPFTMGTIAMPALVCTEPPIAGIISGHETGVIHVTFLTSGKGAGTFWVTGTLRGDFTLATATTTYTGTFVVWFGENGNLRNQANTFTLNVKLTALDGTTTSVHQVAHLNTSGTTSIDANMFFKVGCH
jgi:hypothetical protein